MTSERRAIAFLQAAARTVRSTWMILGISLAFLLGLELAFAVLYAIRDAVVSEPPASETWPDFRRATSILRNAPWSAEYAREWDESYVTTWRPYVYWRRQPYQGHYINVDEHGLRHTVNPVSWEEADLRVIALGGSTMWGTGSRDEGTIASHLSRQLNAQGTPRVHVENRGESGYVSTQELLDLYLQLRDGRAPHVVIFYDGFNDLHAAHQDGEAGIPMNESHRREEFHLARKVDQPYVLRKLWIEDIAKRSSLVRGLQSIRGRILPHPAPSATKPDTEVPPRRNSGSDLEALARAIVHDYVTNVEEARGLADRYGFRAFFFWQPMLATKDVLSSEEQAAAEWWGSESLEFERRVNELLAEVAQERPYIVDLQNLFDGDSQTTFLDYVHIGEDGNARVAAAMVEAMGVDTSEAATASDDAPRGSGR